MKKGWIAWRIPLCDLPDLVILHVKCRIALRFVVRLPVPRHKTLLETLAAGDLKVNARMGGGPVYAMNQYVWGIDLVEEQFLSSCGIPSRPYLSKVPRKCIAEFSVNAQKTGIIQNVDWVDVRIRCPTSAFHACCLIQIMCNLFKPCSADCEVRIMNAHYTNCCTFA